MKKSLHTLLFIVCVCFFSQAQTITPSINNILYVNTNVSGGDQSGDSWANAIPELADALKWANLNQDPNWATTPLQIFVAKGIYKPLYSPEDGNFGNPATRANAFLMVNNVQLYGGFDPANGITSLSDQRILPSLGGTGGGTILSGDFNGNDVVQVTGVYITGNSENAYHVVVSAGAVGSARLDGFTVSGGNADEITSIFTINGLFVDRYKGGGMSNHNSSPFTTNNLFQYNIAVKGGGMYNVDSSPVITNSLFRNNASDAVSSSENDGGGMYNKNSSPVLTNVAFVHNRAIDGGGIYNYNSSPFLTNVTLVRNYSSGVYNEHGSTPTLTNCIMWYNSGEIHNSTDYPPSSATVTYSIVEGSSVYPGTGNLNQYPAFADLANGDYSLKNSSPALNAGSNTAYEAADGDSTNNSLTNDVDLTGNPRLYNGNATTDVIDIGAYEFQGEPLVIQPSANNILYVNINVDQTATGYIGDGSSWANAIPELADALKWANLNQDPNWATTPLQIFVAIGTYQPLYSPADINFGTPSSSDNAFLMVNNVQLYGGFDPVNGIDDLTDTRILPSTGGGGGGFSVLSGDTYHVLISAGPVGSARLDGFTVTGGNANFHTENPNVQAGIVVNGEGDIERNEGAGMLNSHSSPIITNCMFRNNTADAYGGGMYNYVSSPVITNCMFRNNTAGTGGGMHNNNSLPAIINSLFHNNTATSEGGGMYNVYSSPVLTNVTFAGNTANNTGGCMYNQYSSSPTLTNCIVWGNMDGEIVNDLIVNDLTDPPGPIGPSSATVTYSIVEGGYPGTGNLNQYPFFTDPANGDYSLKNSSPALNAGNNLAYEATDGDSANNSLANDVDLAGSPRLYNGNPANDVIDMGAYEFQGEPLVIQPSANNILYVNINVDQTATGYIGDGSSWANAIPELADALKWANLNRDPNWATTPLQIFVAIGTYNPRYSPEDGNFGIPANRDNAFLMVNNVQLYGGFDPANGIVDLNDARLLPSSGGGGGGFSVLSGDISTTNGNTYHVLISAAPVGSARLDGFTISSGTTAYDSGGIVVNGEGNINRQDGAGMYNYNSSPTIANSLFQNNEAKYGGGIYNHYSSPIISNSLFQQNDAFSGGGMYNRNSSPTITNSRFQNNTSSIAGGGIYNHYSSPIISNSLFQNNTASLFEGGGMYNNNSSPTISNSLFKDNTAETKGGGMYNFNSSFTISNSLFQDNTADDMGGGMYNSNSSLVLTNVAFVHNHAINGGGGVYNYYSSPFMTNVTLAGNTADQNTGGGLSNNYSSTPTLTNCIVWGNAGGEIENSLTSSAIVTYSIVEGGYSGTGNLSQYPAFIDPANGDYNLQNNSPAINAGSNTAYEAADGDSANNSLTNDLDLAGNPRLYNGNATSDMIDMGAYEFQGEPIVQTILYVNINVDQTAAGYTGDGSSWANAIPELADALKWANLNQDSDWATTPLQIFVAKGTYKPLYSPEDGNFGIPANRDNAFLMVKNVQLYGGFDPANGITSLSDQRILPSLGGAGGGQGTILSGDIGTANDNSDNTYHVVVSSGPVGNARLDGFSIIGGNADGPTTSFYINGSNIVREYGGGMHNYFSSPTIINCLFQNNTAVKGGGMLNMLSSPFVKNCLFQNNMADEGGGMYIDVYSPVITNSLFQNNVADKGGGIYNSNSSSPILINVTLAGNTSNNNGVVYNANHSTPTLTNCIVWGNTGGEIHGFDLSTVTYSIVEGGYTGVGNSNQDPLFANPANGDYSLQNTSPAINTGSNTAYTNAGGDLTNDVDLTGNPRQIDAVIDMGAYEYQSPVITFIYQDDTTGWLTPPGNPNGVATASDNVKILTGTANFTQDISIRNLTVNPGATLKIEQVLNIDRDIINNGSIVFVNDASKLGQLDDMAGSTISGSGEVTVQRYIPKRDDNKGAYRYITSAVNSSESINANWQEGATDISQNPNPGFGMFITGSTTGANGFDQTASGAPSMFTFDGTTQAYVPIPNTNTDQLLAGTPYTAYVWGDRSVDIISSNDPLATSTTLRATGSLVTGNQIFTGGSLAAGEFNLLGNPYQAIVDMNDVLANSININPNLYYVWDPNLGTRGAYATVSLPSGSPTPSTSEANQFLQPGQAAFLSIFENGISYVVFEESDKDVTAVPTDVFRPQNMASIELQLFQSIRFANGQTLSDGVRVNFIPGGNNTVLLNDAPKLPNFDENIAFVNGNAHLAIENRAMPIDGEVLQLYNDQYRVSEYTFKTIVQNLPDNTTAYLKDAYLNTQTQLNINGPTLINFSVDNGIPASIAPDRFSIVFAVNGLSTDDFINKGFTLYPNPVKENVFFILTSGISGEKAQVALYDLLGQRVYQAEKEVGGNNRISVETNNLQAGVYIVKMTCNGKMFSEKLIVQ